MIGYLVTETNNKLGFVTEIWDRKFETHEEAVDAVMDYLQKESDLPMSLDVIRKCLDEEGYVVFGKAD